MSKSSSFVSAPGGVGSPAPPGWPGRSGCAGTLNLHVTPNRLSSGRGGGSQEYLISLGRSGALPWLDILLRMENEVGNTGPCVPQSPCCFLLPTGGALPANSAPSREAHLRPPPSLLPWCWESSLRSGTGRAPAGQTPPLPAAFPVSAAASRP